MGRFFLGLAGVDLILFRGDDSHHNLVDQSDPTSLFMPGNVPGSACLPIEVGSGD